MEQQQNWSTEQYKGMDVHVSVLQKEDGSRQWDYTVRISEPGADSSAESELSAESGDDGDYASPEEALAAGLKRGYALVDQIQQ
jgi:hypothetical protein